VLVLLLSDRRGSFRTYPDSGRAAAFRRLALSDPQSLSIACQGFGRRVVLQAFGASQRVVHGAGLIDRSLRQSRSPRGLRRGETGDGLQRRDHIVGPDGRGHLPYDHIEYRTLSVRLVSTTRHRRLHPYRS
jgi:hypothetical protein